MTVRIYDGTDDVTKFAKGGELDVALAGFTIAMLVKRTNTGTGLQTFLSMNENDGDSWTWAFGVIDNGDLFYIERAGGDLAEGAAGFQSADGWCVVVATKPAGAGQTVRFHMLPIGGAWAHMNGSTGVDNAATPTASARIYIGGNQNGSPSNFAGIKVACAGVINSNSSDGTVEGWNLHAGLQEWVDAFAGGWVVGLDQASVATAIPDLSTDGTGDEVAETGTTVEGADDPAGFDFTLGGGGDATVNPAVIACTTTLPASQRSIGAAPAVIASTTALPASQRSIGAAPAVVATTVVLPASQRSIGAAPAPVAAVTALPASTRSIGVTPAPVAATTALPQSAVSIGVAPAVVALVVALPLAAAGQNSGVVNPTTIALTAALLQPAIHIGVVPAVIALAVALAQPSQVGTPSDANVNPPGPLMAGAVLYSPDAVAGATSSRAGMVGGIT